MLASEFSLTGKISYQDIFFNSTQLRSLKHDNREHAIVAASEVGHHWSRAVIAFL
jgi:hypothetical protein